MSKDELCERISGIIADYRQGEIPRPDAAHVGRWIDQFPGPVQEPILSELAHVLDRIYISKENVETFLKAIATSETIVGDDAVAFWRGARLLRLQQKGNSQRDMLHLFDSVLRESCGIGVAECGAEPHTYVYLDDAIFSGNRVKSDLIRWIGSEAPPQAKVTVITMAVHALGQFFADRDIAEAAKQAGKSVAVAWRHYLTVEDRKRYMAGSDVLRPKSIPDEAAAYTATLGAEPILRVGDSVGPLGLFSSDAGRALLEQEFLKAGVRIRGLCGHLDAYMRPLGRTMLRTTGFGSMFVTYRNIPNNAPLALWAGDPWRPLFPRRTN